MLAFVLLSNSLFFFAFLFQNALRFAFAFFPLLGTRLTFTFNIKKRNLGPTRCALRHCILHSSDDVTFSYYSSAYVHFYQLF